MTATTAFLFKVTPRGVEVHFDAGSPAEGLAILEEGREAFRKSVSFDIGNIAAEDALATSEIVEVSVSSAPAPAPTTGKRGGKKGQLDPATATAPAPAPIPSAPPAAPVPPLATAPSAPVDTTPNANGIPAFLDRSQQPAAQVARPQEPPVPPIVAAPPVVPASAPPMGVLANKILAEVNRRAVGSPDNGAGINGWLLQSMVACQLVQAVANIDEARAVLPFQTDDKVASIAAQLQIA